MFAFFLTRLEILHITSYKTLPKFTIKSLFPQSVFNYLSRNNYCFLFMTATLLSEHWLNKMAA